ncbi:PLASMODESMATA CALLOSE-BINDING PROTEIN 3-like [Lotus japonicus]|uniref:PLASMODESMATA CALLOSE-BINDING PROTEIN 3-like n=1 Tax=Lotus japonicus TaxID=34305 RepID=UPI00258C46FE|nr:PLASMODESMATA CALLOSE-BINDING PROTEIN 3-like [Lotus japonicus]
MATSFAPQNSFSLLLLIIVITARTMNLMTVAATWCVARSTATPGELQVSLDYACGHGADCSAIQPGGSCYEPNTIYNHASYAFNSYYQHMHQAPDSCSFGGTATIALTDPRTMNVMIVTATWCVAKNTASPDELQVGLDYACGHGADCSAIQPGGSCYEPNTVQNHASYAFNSYYQHMHQAPDSCDFSGTATIATTDPSFGQCVYPSQRLTEGASTSITMPAKDKQSATIDSKLKTFSGQRIH